MNFKQMTTEQVWEEFQSALQLTAKGLRRAAEAWVELKNRGEDLSAYQNSLTNCLPDIASGKLNPELVVRYGANRKILSTLSTLVPEDQAKLAEDKATVEVLTPAGPKRRRVLDLTVAEQKQVFGDGKIRTPAEQKRHMPKALKASKPVKAPEPLDADDTDSAICSLLLVTARQAQQLKSAAASRGMSLADLLKDLCVRNKIMTETKVLRSKWAATVSREQRV